MLPNQIFILGGGGSVRHLGAIDKGLFKFLQDKFVIGINFSYKFVNTTCNLGVDENMYEGTGEFTPEIHKQISSLPLWIGKTHRDIKHPEPNSIFLKPSKVYNKNLNGGVYRASLSGIFALSLAIKLMNLTQKSENYNLSVIKNPEIYLLGFDYGPLIINGQIQLDKYGKPISHWYQDDFKHRGTGKVSWYKQTGIDTESGKRLAYADLEFRPFAKEKDIKIFNVCPISNIPHFEKMEYETLFTKSLTSVHNQDSLRRELKEVLLWIKNDLNI